jgi:hypothetical protein
MSGLNVNFCWGESTQYNWRTGSAKLGIFFGIEYITLRNVWGGWYTSIHICLSDCMMSLNGTCGSSIRGFGFLSDYVGRGVSRTLPHVGRSLVQRISLVLLFDS